MRLREPSTRSIAWASAPSVCFPPCSAIRCTIRACGRSCSLHPAHPGTAIFVHCGALSVGVRKKLGLPSRFDVRLGNPARPACACGRLPRCGVHRSALRRGAVSRSAARRRPVPQHLPRHVEHQPVDGLPPIGLTLADVFRQGLAVLGPDRLLFGTDSSFFPRGWNREVHQAQVAALDSAGIDGGARERILAAISTAFFPSDHVLRCYDQRNYRETRNGQRTGVRGRPIGADQHHPGHPKALAPEACRPGRSVRRRRLPPHAARSRPMRSRRSSSARVRSSPSVSAW